MTGLVEVAVMVSIQLQTTRRQYDMETSKTEHDRASERMEELQRIRSEVIYTYIHCQHCRIHINMQVNLPIY